MTVRELKVWVEAVHYYLMLNGLKGEQYNIDEVHRVICLVETEAGVDLMTSERKWIREEYMRKYPEQVYEDAN